MYKFTLVFPTKALSYGKLQEKITEIPGKLREMGNYGILRPNYWLTKTETPDLFKTNTRLFLPRIIELNIIYKHMYIIYIYI